MDLQPLPIEKELRIENIKRSLTKLSREDLIENFAWAIDILTRMTHQTMQLLDRVKELENPEV